MSNHTSLDRNDPRVDTLLLATWRERGVHSAADLRQELRSQVAEQARPVVQLPVPAAPYSGDGLEVAFGPDEQGRVQAYLHTGTETIVLAWDAFLSAWAGKLADGRSFQVIPAMVVIARPADETAPMLWRKVVM